VKLILRGIFVFFIVFPAGVFSQKLFVKSYTSTDGLAQNQVFTIHQDDKGFIWFGTGGGLSRYDGRVFRNYTKEQGLISNVIRDIIQTKEKILWLATDEGLSRYSAATDSFVNYNSSDGLGQGTVRALLEDARGNLWCATADGLSVLERSSKNFLNFTTADQLPSNVILSLAAGDSNSIYVGTLEGIAHVRLRADHRLEITHDYSTRDGLINNRIEALLYDSFGRLWVGTGVGLTKIEKEKFVNYTTASGLPHNSIRAIMQDSHGKLWFATDGGLSQTQSVGNEIRFKNYYAENGFGSSQFYTVIEDHEHNLWLGTPGKGARKLMSEDLVSYDKSQGLLNEVTISVTKDSFGKFIIGTISGLSVFHQNRFQSYTDADGISGTEIWDVISDSSGVLWLATNMGLQILIPQNYFELYRNKNYSEAQKIQNLIKQSRKIKDFYAMDLAKYPALSGSRIVDLFMDDQQRIWYASSDKGLGRITVDAGGELHIRVYTMQDGLNTNNIWCLYQDRRHRFWVGTIGGGLSLYNDETDRFHSFTRTEGLADDVALTLREDLKGNLWVGSERGITRIDINKVPALTPGKNFDLHALARTFSVKDGLSDNTVNAIIRDGDGRLWIGTNNGLTEFDPDSEKVNKVYRKRNGLIDNEITTNNSMFLDSDSLLWIGTTGGLTRMPIKTDLSASIPRPLVFLTTFKVEDKNQRQSHNLALRSFNEASPESENSFLARIFSSPYPEISYQENNINLEFIALSFKDETDIRYRYRLIGFENEWSDPTADNRVRYTNLNEGRYTFEIMAANGMGIWSEKPFPVHFTIMTPFWKSWWFFLFVAMFFSLSGYTVYRFRINLVRLRTAELEEKVLHRTKELIVQKETVERILNELKETQMHLIHSEKMASLGQMVAGIAHEINNPITYVKANIALLEKKAGQVEKLFTVFSDVFDFYEPFKEITDERHEAFKKKLDEIDQLIGTTRFEKFLDEFPRVIAEMKDGVERTQKIVEDLRNFSRLDESQFKEISVTDSIESTLNILKNEFKNRITIHRNFGPLPLIFCNPGHINQVLMNLFTNAFQAIDGQGDVWIRTTAGLNNILVSIKDNGKGIPYEIQHKVYDPFFTTKPVGKGTGLGLSISYKILEAHKGTIFFESEPGKGTEFKITLPIRRAG
jgi:signal transduction histidine kinase/ligand-binding sensor domain-containing protein